MGNHLRIRFFDDGDGTGKLLVCAQADGFRGESGAYFNVDRLESFAQALQEFPLPAKDARRSIASGFGSPDAPLEQEHVAISVYPVDTKRGYIGIQVRMATPIWPDTRPESKKQATIELLTTYEPLSKFAKEIEWMLRGAREKATIDGDGLS